MSWTWAAAPLSRSGRGAEGTRGRGEGERAGGGWLGYRERSVEQVMVVLGRQVRRVLRVRESSHESRCTSVQLAAVPGLVLLFFRNLNLDLHSLDCRRALRKRQHRSARFGFLRRLLRPPAQPGALPRAEEARAFGPSPGRPLPKNNSLRASRLFLRLGGGAPLPGGGRGMGEGTGVRAPLRHPPALPPPHPSHRAPVVSFSNGALARRTFPKESFAAPGAIFPGRSRPLFLLLPNLCLPW